MKKIKKIVLIAVLSLGLASCGKVQEKNDEESLDEEQACADIAEIRCERTFGDCSTTWGGEFISVEECESYLEQFCLDTVPSDATQDDADDCLDVMENGTCEEAGDESELPCKLFL